MRHGANIPDIRALLPLLTSIDSGVASLSGSLSTAFPDTEPYTGLAPVRFNQRVKVLDLDTQRATIHNPQDITVRLSTRYGDVLRLEPFASVSLELGGGREIYANAVDGVGTLIFDAERNLAGAIEGTLDVVEISANTFGTPVFHANRILYFETITEGAFSRVTADGSVFEWDLNTAAGIDGSIGIQDVVKGKPWHVLLDENTGDIYSVNPIEETFENVASPEAFPSNNRLQPVKTPSFEGYVYCATTGSGDAYVYDSDWNLLTTITGTELITADQGQSADTTIYSSDHILLQNLDTSIFGYLDLINLTYTEFDGASDSAYEGFALERFSVDDRIQRRLFDNTIETVDFGLGAPNSFIYAGLLLFDNAQLDRQLGDPVSGSLSSPIILDNSDAAQYNKARTFIVSGTSLEVRNPYTSLYTVDLPTSDIFGGQIVADVYTDLISLLNNPPGGPSYYVGTLTETWNPTANL